MDATEWQSVVDIVQHAVERPFQLSACGQQAVCQVQRQIARTCQRIHKSNAVVQKTSDLTLHYTV